MNIFWETDMGKRAGLNNKFDLRKVFINPSGKCRKFP